MGGPSPLQSSLHAQPDTSPESSQQQRQLQVPPQPVASPWQMSSTSRQTDVSANALFDSLDRNGDGILSREELSALSSRQAFPTSHDQRPEMSFSGGQPRIVSRQDMSRTTGVSYSVSPGMPLQQHQQSHQPLREVGRASRLTPMKPVQVHGSYPAPMRASAASSGVHHTLDPARVQQVASAAAAQAAATSLHHNQHGRMGIASVDMTQGRKKK